MIPSLAEINWAEWLLRREGNINIPLIQCSAFYIDAT
jgi:hypothetical protein